MSMESGRKNYHIFEKIKRKDALLTDPGIVDEDADTGAVGMHDFITKALDVLDAGNVDQVARDERRFLICLGFRCSDIFCHLDGLFELVGADVADRDAAAGDLCSELEDHFSAHPTTPPGDDDDAT